MDPVATAVATAVVVSIAAVSPIAAIAVAVAAVAVAAVAVVAIAVVASTGVDWTCTGNGQGDIRGHMLTRLAAQDFVD